MQARIILSGYYGFGNTGDEAILASLIEGLSGPDREIVVLSASPERTRREHDVRAIDRTDLSALLRELSQAKLLVSGGGGLLQDVTGPFSVAYYLGIIKIAQWMRVKTMLMAQGIGPVLRPLNRRLIGQVGRKVDLATVRDPDSAAMLARWGIPEDRIMVTADPVLGLSPAPREQIVPMLRRVGLSLEKPIMAVAIRPWHTWYERQFKAFSAVLAQLASQQQAQILLLPFQYPGDLRITQELHDCLKMRTEAPFVTTMEFPISAPEMMGIIGACDLVVGMRLHSLIMAAAQAVPAIGISYDPKVTQFGRQMNLPMIESVSELAAIGATSEALSDAWQARGDIHRLLTLGLPEWRHQVSLNYQLALQLCGVNGVS